MRNQRSLGGRSASSSERGSAMLAAMFVLFLLSTTGLSLLFLGTTEAKMGRQSTREKQAFYLSEAGEEFARTALWITNGNGPFNDDLAARAGANGVFDLDVANLGFVYNVAGVPTGLTGIGDDTPLVAVTTLATGWYATLLTNDPAEPGGVTSTVDTNKLVMLTSISVGKNKSEGEIVQAIVERKELLPQLPPATITLLGPLPDFHGGTSNHREYIGSDCNGRGIPGLTVPVIGTVGDSAETSAEGGVKLQSGPDYTSGSFTNNDTVVDLTDSSDPILRANNYSGLSDVYTDCQKLHDLVEKLREVADVTCAGNPCTFPTTRYSNVIFVDGDLDVNAPGGSGTLVVTGVLRYDGQAGWNGMIYAVGEGRYVQKGSGNGVISGAIVVADVAGPDDVYGTADDCSGGDDGFSTAVFDMDGGGNALTQYCSQDITNFGPNPPYRIVNFRQG